MFADVGTFGKVAGEEAAATGHGAAAVAGAVAVLYAGVADAAGVRGVVADEAEVAEGLVEVAVRASGESEAVAGATSVALDAVGVAVGASVPARVGVTDVHQADRRRLDHAVGLPASARGGVRRDRGRSAGRTQEVAGKLCHRLLRQPQLNHRENHTQTSPARAMQPQRQVHHRHQQRQQLILRRMRSWPSSYQGCVSVSLAW
mmetsp:Transcript_44127/g.116765  ORF Transcript_44127/g.116765 Transcript_44127/m.116765 type:complete len:203 (-) Transcript_44127:746-1354(-)